MHRPPLPRRLLGALAATMAAVGLALVTAGLLPGPAASAGDGVRAVVHLDRDEMIVATAVAPVLMGARVALRLLAHPVRDGRARG